LGSESVGINGEDAGKKEKEKVKEKEISSIIV
jgi:hypothetical protein